jgi:hypothetical protein
MILAASCCSRSRRRHRRHCPTRCRAHPLFPATNQYLAAFRAGQPPGGRPATVATSAELVEPKKDSPLPDAQRRELIARAGRAVGTGAGFVERLVMFWSNFFAVGGDRSQPVLGTVGAFEREAIRPYVFGRFGDMLLAVTRHPTILSYVSPARPPASSRRGPMDRASVRSAGTAGTRTRTKGRSTDVSVDCSPLSTRPSTASAPAWAAPGPSPSLPSRPSSAAPRE